MLGFLENFRKVITSANIECNVLGFLKKMGRFEIKSFNTDPNAGKKKFFQFLRKEIFWGKFGLEKLFFGIWAKASNFRGKSVLFF